MAMAGVKIPWTEAERDVIRKNYMVTDIKLLCPLLPRREPHTIRLQARRMGLFRFWQESENDIIRENYGELSVQEIAEMLPGRGRKAVAAQAGRLGLGGRYFHEVDVGYFAAPAVQNSYWAGFIAADGCVYEPNNSVNLSLSVKDLEHLQRFKADVGYSGPVRRWVGKTGYKPGAEYAGMTIYDVPQWLSDLKRWYNIGPRKTHTLMPPARLEDVSSMAYIAGFLDGDGSVTKKYGKIFTISVGGRRQVLEWIKTKFDAVSPVTKKSMPLAAVTKDKDKDFWRYGISGRRALVVAAVFNSMGVPLLTRKWGAPTESEPATTEPVEAAASA